MMMMMVMMVMQYNSVSHSDSTMSLSAVAADFSKLSLQAVQHFVKWRRKCCRAVSLIWTFVVVVVVVDYTVSQKSSHL